MELVFKIACVIMFFVLSIGYIETRIQHKKAVAEHVSTTDKIRDFVEKKLESLPIPEKHAHGHK